MKKLIPVLLLLLAACKPDAPKIPEGIIAPGKMSLILEDIHIADAVAETKAQSGGNEAELTKQYYAVVYAKYNISEADFIKSYKYYEQNPVWLNKVYDGVLNDLSKKEEQVGKQ